MYSLQLYLQVLGEYFLLTRLFYTVTSSARTVIDRTTSVYYAVLHARFVTPVLYRFILKVIFYFILFFVHLNTHERARVMGHTFCVPFPILCCIVIEVFKETAAVSFQKRASFVRAIIAPKSWDIIPILFLFPYFIVTLSRYLTE